MFLNCTGGFRLNALRRHMMENSLTNKVLRYYKLLIRLFTNVQSEHMAMPDGHPQMPSHSIT